MGVVKEYGWLRKLASLLYIGDREMKFARAASGFYVSSAFSATSRFLVMAVIIRYLGYHDYGLLVLAMSTSAILYGFLDVRAEEGVLVKALGEAGENREREMLHLIYAGYLVKALVALLSYVAIYMLAPFIADHVFHNPVQKSLLRICGIAWFFQAFITVPSTVFLIFHEYVLLNILVCVENIWYFLFPALLLPFRLRGVLSGFIVAYAVTAATMVFFSGRVVSNRIGVHKISFRDVLSSARGIFPFLFHSFIASTFKSFHSYFSFMVLGYFRSPMDVTYFKIASSYSGMLTFAISPVVSPMLSKFSHLYAEDKRELFTRALAKARLYLFLASLMGSVFLLVSARILLPLFFGEDARNGLAVAYLLTGYAFISNAHLWMRGYLISILHPEWLTFLNALFAMVSLLLTVFLTQYYGAEGAAFALLVSFVLVVLPLSLWFIKKERALHTVFLKERKTISAERLNDSTQI